MTSHLLLPLPLPPTSYLLPPTSHLNLLPPTSYLLAAEVLWNLSRHVVASVYILYFQLAGGASDGGKQVTESEWQVLLQTGLLSPDEKRKLAEYRGFKPFLLQVGVPGGGVQG